MNNVLRFMSGFLVLATYLTLTASPSVAHPSIDIFASKAHIRPNTIELHVGEKSLLRIISTEGVHTIESDELGVPETTITPTNFTTVSVTPEKAGTYVIHCSDANGAREHIALKVNVLP